MYIAVYGITFEWRVQIGVPFSFPLHVAVVQEGRTRPLVAPHHLPKQSTALCSSRSIPHDECHERLPRGSRSIERALTHCQQWPAPYCLPTERFGMVARIHQAIVPSFPARDLMASRHHCKPVDNGYMSSR